MKTYFQLNQDVGAIGANPSLTDADFSDDPVLIAKAKELQAQTTTDTNGSAQTPEPNGEASNGSADAKLEIGEGDNKVSFKKTWSDTATGAPETVTQVVDSEALKKENDALRKLLDIPSVKLMVAGSANNKSLFQIVREAGGVDPDSLSDEQIFTEDLKTLGITDEDSITMELKAFRDRMPSEQKRIINPIKEKMRTEREANLGKLGEKELSLFNTNKEQQKAAKEQNLAQYQALVTTLKGQKLYGVIEVTDQMTKELQEAYTPESHILPLRSDGTLDPAELLNYAIFKKYKGLLFDTIAKNSAGEIFAEIQKRTVTPQNPSGAHRFNAQMPTKEQQDKDFE